MLLLVGSAAAKITPWVVRHPLQVRQHSIAPNLCSLQGVQIGAIELGLSGVRRKPACKPFEELLIWI
jgi:hypothetical protein